MKCEQCRTSKHQMLYPYGGMNLCFSCNERHNPVVSTVKRLDPKQRERMEDRALKLMKELRELEHDIKIDKELEAKGHDFVDFIVPRKHPELSF